MTSMRTETISLRTSEHVTDVTEELRRFASAAGGDGLVHAFLPHATAGLALMEVGSGSERDLEEVLGRLLPRDERWTHSHGSPGHGADHVLPVFVSPSISIPVIEGGPQLGMWQSLVVVDLNRDNPDRKIRFSFLPA